jgi:hypothetical protein
VRWLVVLLRFSSDDGKENLLLPGGWLTGAIEPGVSGLTGATKGSNDLGSGIRGERIREGHGQILPDKKKYAMQKILLDKCLQCGHLTHMTKATAQRRIEMIPAAIKGTKDNLKEVLKKNAERGVQWNDQRCIEAHQAQINALKKQLKEAREVLV